MANVQRNNGIGCGSIIMIALCVWAFMTYGPLNVLAVLLVLMLIIGIIGSIK